MFLAIDPQNGVAIYEQIVRQVNFAVAAEVLVAGDLVPSVRELARQLAVNPNTVARAYRQLQSDGVLETVRGTGLAVSAGAAWISGPSPKIAAVTLRTSTTAGLIRAVRSANRTCSRWPTPDRKVPSQRFASSSSVRACRTPKQ